MMQNSTVFEHLVKEKDFFSGFSFCPVSPSLLAIEKSWFNEKKKTPLTEINELERYLECTFHSGPI